MERRFASRDALVLVTTSGPSSGDVTVPCTVQTPCQVPAGVNTPTAGSGADTRTSNRIPAAGNGKFIYLDVSKQDLSAMLLLLVLSLTWRRWMPVIEGAYEL